MFKYIILLILFAIKPSLLTAQENGFKVQLRNITISKDIISDMELIKFIIEEEAQEIELSFEIRKNSIKVYANILQENKDPIFKSKELTTLPEWVTLIRNVKTLERIDYSNALNNIHTFIKDNFPELMQEPHNAIVSITPAIKKTSPIGDIITAKKKCITDTNEKIEFKRTFLNRITTLKITLQDNVFVNRAKERPNTYGNLTIIISWQERTNIWQLFVDAIGLPSRIFITNQSAVLNGILDEDTDCSPITIASTNDFTIPEWLRTLDEQTFNQINYNPNNDPALKDLNKEARLTRFIKGVKRFIQDTFKTHEFQWPKEVQKASLFQRILENFNYHHWIRKLTDLFRGFSHY